MLCGLFVVWFARGKKGTPLQVIAVLCSVLGMLIGKYLTFFHFLKEAVKEEYGPEIAANVGMFSQKVLQFFFDNIGEMLNPYDLLWVTLAVVAAWGIPRSSGIKLPPSETYTPSGG